MLRLLRVQGDSLSPEYQEGDFVVLAAIVAGAAGPFFSRRLKPGDVIVFRHVQYGTLIKKVERVTPEGIEVAGTHPDSLDSRLLGSIDARDVVGKVIWHIGRPG